MSKQIFDEIGRFGSFHGCYGINTLELKKVSSRDKSQLVRWLRFLDITNDEEELDKIQIHGNVFKLAADELKRLSADKQMRIIIEAREIALRYETTFLSGA